MRVFVAGATGAIGRQLVPRRGVRRARPHAVQRALADAAPDAVVHELTGLPPNLNPRKYKRQLAGTNRLRREGTANLVAAARAAGARRLVAQSIAFAYAPTGEWVKDEDAPLAVEAAPPMSEAIEAVAELERGGSGVYNIVDDEPARAADWIPVYVTAAGGKPPLHLPAWLGRLAAGQIAVAGMTTQRGASNAKAKRELAWAPGHPSWRDGFRASAR
jgi:nucleoside-diphosphate-sugar epimerase